MAKQGDFDAIVVGSGPTGGVAAWALTAKGLEVAVLEAGPDLGRSAHGSTVANAVSRFARTCLSRDQPVQQRHPAYWAMNPRLFVSDRDNPYETPAAAPFTWIRGRQVGGRSHMWGGVCLRFSDYEFAPPGMWPLGHRDLDPSYGRIERLLEVCGSRDGLAQLPDGDFTTAGLLSPAEAQWQRALAERFGRRAVISRGIRATRRPERGFAASRLSSNRTSLAAALATGRLTLRAQTVAIRIPVDATTGRATGVECVDAASGAATTLRAPLVVLCASTIETVRLMMNSRSERFPAGIGGASGLLGRGIMDHVTCTVPFHMPSLGESHGFPLLGGDGLLIPRYEFAGPHRGFGYWGGVSRTALPRWLRRRPDAALGFLCGMGEATRDDDNRVTIDPQRKDRWGAPCASVRYTWHADDLRLAERMRADAAAMIAACGGEQAGIADIVRLPRGSRFAAELDRRCTMSAPGAFVHEVGGARMGAAPADSVVNAFGQVWDCPNLVLGDGSTFVTSGWQNPTLTEMALCLRACDHAADRQRAGEL